jgi:hypothetical protein
MNGNFPAFVWNKSGLNAYKNDDSGIYNNTFVRFDQYGLYGISNAATDGAEFNPNIADEEGNVGEKKIKAIADFALTWSGF